MSKSMKSKLRIAGIIIVLAVFGLFAFSKMNIEPADYSAQVQSKIEEASKLVENSTDNSLQSKSELIRCIEKAQSVLDNSNSTYSEKKNALQELEDGINSFKNSATASSSTANTQTSDGTTVKCTISIVCDNLIGYEFAANKSNKKDYVPKDGVILAPLEVEIESGKSVFDVLNSVCRDKGIQLSSRFTPIYNSYYIESINHLSEFDAGKLSGWMYRVNNKYPNYGCSSYIVSNNDVIVWAYTTDCGVDLGQPQY